MGLNTMTNIVLRYIRGIYETIAMSGICGMHCIENVEALTEVQEARFELRRRMMGFTLRKADVLFFLLSHGGLRDHAPEQSRNTARQRLNQFETRTTF